MPYIVVALIISIILLWGIIAACRAPFGYEDEYGYHNGKPGPTHDNPSRDTRS